MTAIGRRTAGSVTAGRLAAPGRLSRMASIATSANSGPETDIGHLDLGALLLGQYETFHHRFANGDQELDWSDKLLTKRVLAKRQGTPEAHDRAGHLAFSTVSRHGDPVGARPPKVWVSTEGRWATGALLHSGEADERWSPVGRASAPLVRWPMSESPTGPPRRIMSG